MNYIRINKYAQLTGLTNSTVRARIKNGKLKVKMIGGTQHVPYPEESEIKFHPVKQDGL